MTTANGRTTMRVDAADGPQTPDAPGEQDGRQRSDVAQAGVRRRTNERLIRDDRQQRRRDHERGARVGVRSPRRQPAQELHDQDEPRREERHIGEPGFRVDGLHEPGKETQPNERQVSLELQIQPWKRAVRSAHRAPVDAARVFDCRIDQQRPDVVLVEIPRDDTGRSRLAAASSRYFSSRERRCSADTFGAHRMPTTG